MTQWYNEIKEIAHSFDNWSKTILSSSKKGGGLYIRILEILDECWLSCDTPVYVSLESTYIFYEFLNRSVKHGKIKKSTTKITN